MLRGDMFCSLSPELEAHLRQVNPWWEGRPGRVLPPYRRWAFRPALRKLEAALAPALVIRGPRQVGKTTIQEQIIHHLLTEKGVAGNRILRVQFDDIPSLKGLKDPILAIVRWFERWILGCSLNEAAHSGQPAYVFLDEAQKILAWAPQVKALVDHHTVRVVVAGSSALRIEAGHDSLAGRVVQLDLGTLLLREIAALRFGEDIDPLLPQDDLGPLLRPEFWRSLAEQGRRFQEVRDRAFTAFSQRGGYPVAQAMSDQPWPEVADYLNQMVIQRTVEHDLRMGGRGQKRDPRLLEEVFRLACRYAGQSPSKATYVAELHQAKGANIGWQRVLAYLKFLDGSLLVKLLPPLELRLKRLKGNSKLCLCDHGLRASWLQEVIPLDPQELKDAPHLGDLAGHLAESTVGYFLSGLPHLDVAHFPERDIEPEVDFILTVGSRRIPLEVKYRQRIDPHRDTLGLRHFLERAVYDAPLGVLVTMHDDVEVADPRIVAVSLRSLLLMR